MGQAVVAAATVAFLGHRSSRPCRVIRLHRRPDVQPSDPLYETAVQSAIVGVASTAKAGVEAELVGAAVVGSCAAHRRRPRSASKPDSTALPRSETVGPGSSYPPRSTAFILSRLFLLMEATAGTCGAFYTPAQ